MKKNPAQENSRVAGMWLTCRTALALAAVAALALAGTYPALAGGYTSQDPKNPKILGSDPGLSIQQAMNPQTDAKAADAFAALPASLNIPSGALTQTQANVLGVGVSALHLQESVPGSFKTPSENFAANLQPAGQAVGSLESKQYTFTGLNLASMGMLTGSVGKLAEMSGLKIETVPAEQKLVTVPAEKVVVQAAPASQQVGMYMSLYSETHTGLEQSISGADFSATKEYFDNKPVHFEVSYNNGPESLRKQDVAISTSEDKLITQTVAVSQAGEQTVAYNEKGAPISILNIAKTEGVADGQGLTQVQTDNSGKITSMVTDSQAGRTEIQFNSDGSADMLTQKTDGTQEQAAIIPFEDGWDKITFGDVATVKGYQPDAVMLFALKHNAGANPLTQFVAEHNQKTQAEQATDKGPRLKIMSADTAETQPSANLTVEQKVQQAIVSSKVDGYVNRAQTALSVEDAAQKTAQVQAVKTEAKTYYDSATGNDRLMAADGLARIDILQCNQGLLNEDQMKEMIAYAQESGNPMTIMQAAEAAAKSAQKDTIGSGEGAISLLAVAAATLTDKTIKADKFGPALFEVDYAQAEQQIKSTFLTMGKTSSDIFTFNETQTITSVPENDPVEMIASVQNIAKTGNLQLARERAQQAESLRAASLPADQQDDYILSLVSSYLVLGQAEKTASALE